ncbi:MAG: hypothetical protein Q7T56_07755 [Nocardioidaceae bacterium]|nr:hypothetical protein [Nocardioidaceae bacterium]
MTTTHPHHDPERPARPWTDRWERDGGALLVVAAVALAATLAVTMRMLLP